MRIDLRASDRENIWSACNTIKNTRVGIASRCEMRDGLNRHNDNKNRGLSE